MKALFDPACVAGLQEELNRHPVYGAVQSLGDLRVFMTHHVFSVWDFMSVVKYLQKIIAPTDYPWAPRGNGSVRYFINQLVLEEESDEGLPAPDGSTTYASHFELYTQAMLEVGANPAGARKFVGIASIEGIEAALAAGIAPAASAAFMKTTFGFIGADRPHELAAAFALGREHIIPGMFRSFLSRMRVSEDQAPAFHYYLRRHIHLDEDFHGPISLKLLNELCRNDPNLVAQAEDAAKRAIGARIAFWDGVLEAIETGHV